MITRRRMHFSVAREYLITMIREHGPEILGRPELTTAAAIEMVRDMPEDYVTVGECDNVLSDGRCGGHKA